MCFIPSSHLQNGLYIVPCVLHEVKTKCGHAFKNVNSYGLVSNSILTSRLFQELYGLN